MQHGNIGGVFPSSNQRTTKGRLPIRTDEMLILRDGPAKMPNTGVKMKALERFRTSVYATNVRTSNCNDRSSLAREVLTVTKDEVKKA